MDGDRYTFEVRGPRERRLHGGAADQVRRLRLLGRGVAAHAACQKTVALVGYRPRPNLSLPMPERYAIYYAPPTASALWQRAAQWLGRDATGGDLEPAIDSGHRPGPPDGAHDARPAGTVSTGRSRRPWPCPAIRPSANSRRPSPNSRSRHRPVPIGQLEVTMLGGFPRHHAGRAAGGDHGTLPPT